MSRAAVNRTEWGECASCDLCALRAYAVPPGVAWISLLCCVLALESYGLGRRHGLQQAAPSSILKTPLLPNMLDVFVDEVVPLLQKRGLFRTEYEGETLREQYGLDRPDAGFA